MSAPRLVVDVSRAVRRGASTEQLRARHLLQGARVLIGFCDDGQFGTRSIAVDEWRAELALLCPDPGPQPTKDQPGLPWELVVATGRALSERRTEAYDALVARADPLVREPLRRIHRETSGRLRLVGAVPSRHRIGWVSWVRLADGWHALTPYVERSGRTTRPMVRLEPRGPADLAHEVARWAAEAHL
jgi:hypothetical protein